MEPHLLSLRKQLRKKFQEAGLVETLDRAEDSDERFDIVGRFVDEHVIPASFGRLNLQSAVLLGVGSRRSHFLGRPRLLDEISGGSV